MSISNTLLSKKDGLKEKTLFLTYLFFNLRSLLEKILSFRKISYGYLGSVNQLGVVHLQIDLYASSLNLFDIH